MEYRVFSKDGNKAVVVPACHGPDEAVAIAKESGFPGAFATPVSGANWQVVQYHQAGGIDPYSAMEKENHQFALQALACEAPDSHGSFMDAPEFIGRGMWR